LLLIAFAGINVCHRSTVNHHLGPQTSAEISHLFGVGGGTLQYLCSGRLRINATHIAAAKKGYSPICFHKKQSCDGSRHFAAGAQQKYIRGGLHQVMKVLLKYTPNIPEPVYLCGTGDSHAVEAREVNTI
jgi:hypothetical protein